MTDLQYTTLEDLLKQISFESSVKPGMPVEVDAWFQDRYELQRYLGIGTTAVALLARDTVIDRPVVLKVSHDHYIASNTMLRDEARALARLDHPAILKVYDYGAEYRSWAVLEYLGQETLQSFAFRCRSNNAPVPYALVESVCQQLGELLEYLHSSANVYQLDLKPGNLSFDATTRRIKMMDFGSVLRVGESNHIRYGTPGYLAPELYSDQNVSTAADIFSFGTLAFELMTGQQPFVNAQRAFAIGVERDWFQMPTTAFIDFAAERNSAQDRISQTNRMMADVFIDDELQNADAPTSFKALVKSMMSFAAAQRPQAHEVCLKLESICSSSPKKQPSVFISHSHRDKERFVKQFVQTLKRRGFQVWVDDESLRVGEPFWERISAAIDSCDFVVAVISRQSVTSDGVAEELRAAQLGNLGENVKILPIRIDPIPFERIPLFLRSRHVLDFVGWEEGEIFSTKVTRLAADMRLMYQRQPE